MTSRRLVPDLERGKSIDFVICNGKDCAGGFGITVDKVPELLENGIDVPISGNHIPYKKEIILLMDKGVPLIRLAN